MSDEKDLGPVFPYPELFPGADEPYRSPSAFMESPFSNTATQTQETFFFNADTTSLGGVDIVTETNVSAFYVEDVTDLIDPGMSSLYGADQTPDMPYTTKVFVSRDDSYLRKAFDKTEPLPNEVCLFLEDNSRDFFSDGSAYVKIGVDFRDDLSKRKDIADVIGAGVNQFEFTNEGNEQNLQIQFTDQQINELIRTGEIVNATRSTLIGIFQAVNFGTVILTPVYKFLGEGVLTVTKGLRDYVKFKDHHWDPQAKATSADAGTGFEPVLFPYSQDVLTALETGGEAAIDEVARLIDQGLRANLRATQSQWAALSQLPGGSYVIPEGISSFLDQSYQMIEDLVERLLSGTRDFVQFYLNVGSKWLNALNAFYCGLWNAIVEAVLGIVDLVGYLFKGLGLVGEGANSAQTLLPRALETIDELIQTAFETDFVTLLANAYEAVKAQLSKLNPMALAGMISVEKVAYFIGGFVGFIAEIVAGMIYSGGLASVGSAMKKFGNIGTDVFAVVTAGTRRLVGEAASFSLASILSIIEKLLDLLRKGKDEVVRLIDAVFDAIRNGAKLADDVLQEIKRVFHLTDEELRILDDAGMAFTSYSNKTCTLCKLTR